MNISLNGEKQTINDGITLSKLAVQLELEGKRFAIEINEELIPRSQHADHLICEGDEIEIVQAIGGG